MSNLVRTLAPATIAQLARCANVRRVAVIDTETTGLSPADDRVWEIGAVIIDADAGSMMRATWRIRLAAPLSPFIAGLAGVDADEVTRVGVDAADALRDFAQCIAGALVIGHNFAAFDAPFLRAEFARAGIAAPAELDDANIVDTMVLAKDILADVQEDIDAVAPLKANGKRSAYYALQSLRAYYNFSQDRAHRAQSDAEVTFKVFRALVIRAQYIFEG